MGYRLLKDLMRSKLLQMTTLACLDGNILSLAMSGSLAYLPIAIVTGLTCIAGIGAWTAVIEEYGGNLDEYRKRRLIATALISVGLVMLTCFVGSTVSITLNMDVLKYFSAVAVFVIGLEIYGIRLPETLPKVQIPTPLAIVVFGLLLEVIVWT